MHWDLGEVDGDVVDKELKSWTGGKDGRNGVELVRCVTSLFEGDG